MPKTKKPAEPKRKLTKSTDVLLHTRHREAISSCPHCDKEPEIPDAKRYLLASWWIEHGHTLIIAEWQGRHAAAVVVSECPHCFEQSWMHWDLTSFDRMEATLPKEWVDAAKAEHRRRNVLAGRVWAEGICWRCTHLESVQIDTHAWRTCMRGCGGPQKDVPASDHFNHCDVFEAAPGLALPQRPVAS